MRSTLNDMIVMTKIAKGAGRSGIAFTGISLKCHIFVRNLLSDVTCFGRVILHIWSVGGSYQVVQSEKKEYERYRNTMLPFTCCTAHSTLFSLSIKLANNFFKVNTNLTQ